MANQEKVTATKRYTLLTFFMTKCMVAAPWLLYFILCISWK